MIAQLANVDCLAVLLLVEMYLEWQKICHVVVRHCNRMHEGNQMVSTFVNIQEFKYNFRITLSPLCITLIKITTAFCTAHKPRVHFSESSATWLGWWDILGPRAKMLLAVKNRGQKIHNFYTVIKTAKLHPLLFTKSIIDL